MMKVRLLAVALFLAGTLAACGKAKLGEPCTLDSTGPVAGTNRLKYAIYDCESEICLSVAGGASYCTQECTSCPSGYTCRTDILVAETGNACSATVPCGQAYSCASGACAPKGFCVR